MWGGSLIRPGINRVRARVLHGGNVQGPRGHDPWEDRDRLRIGQCRAIRRREHQPVWGGTAVTVSDSDGFIYDPEGIDAEKLEWLMDLKNVHRGRIIEYAEHFHAEYFPGQRPWGVEGADVALPCATQNEINVYDAKQLVSNGIQIVAEGANMPTEPDAARMLIDSGVLFGPGKAANAGGVAVSGFEMAQNADFTSWSREEVDARTPRDHDQDPQVMHRQTAEEFEAPNNYVVGANIAGFRKVAAAMLDQGVV